MKLFLIILATASVVLGQYDEDWFTEEETVVDSDFKIEGVSMSRFHMDGM